MTQPDGHHATDVIAINPRQATSPITQPERKPIAGREREQPPHVAELKLPDRIGQGRFRPQ
jgi:hypothetical protein